MDSEDRRELWNGLIGVAIVAAIIFGLGFALMSGVPPAHGHDWKRPDLDAWYGSLKNPHASSRVVRDIGCCSKDDCHETAAEMRGNDWWARLGRPVTLANGQRDWEPQDWVKVPAEAVLLHQDNPTGSAVICHSVNLARGGGIDPAATTVFCFIPPTES